MKTVGLESIRPRAGREQEQQEAESRHQLGQEVYYGEEDLGRGRDSHGDYLYGKEKYGEDPYGAN